MIHNPTPNSVIHVPDEKLRFLLHSRRRYRVPFVSLFAALRVRPSGISHPACKGLLIQLSTFDLHRTLAEYAMDPHALVFGPQSRLQISPYQHMDKVANLHSLLTNGLPSDEPSVGGADPTRELHSDLPCDLCHLPMFLNPR